MKFVAKAPSTAMREDRMQHAQLVEKGASKRKGRKHVT